ncbi:Ankyrin repeats (3 copies) family protein [Acanthocheilonema viteae]
MEQPMQVAADSSSIGSQLPQSNSASPGLSRKRISKVLRKNERGETALHVAARKGEHRLCKKLIEEGALINARDYAGWTPLHEACYHGHFKVAKLLLGYDADVNALSDCDDTPLHDAVTSGNEKLVWLLLHSGAIRDRVDNDGKKPIDICHPEYSGIRSLLSTAVVPELYSLDESPSLSPSSPTHAQSSSQMLTVNVIQFTPEKQCLTSPNSDDSVASAETFPRERNTGISEELRMQLQGTCSQTLSGGEDMDRNTKVPDFDSVVSRDEEVKAVIHHGFNEIDPPFSMQRSLWPEERSETLKSVGLRTDSSPYEFDHDLTSSHVLFENTCFGISESKETEIRHIGHVRTHTERFSPQYTSQKSTYNEKRKQRGRRRGQGISTTAGSAVITAQASQANDVYEFRSSPESDVGVNKTGSAEDMERELSESPSLKKQRFSQSGTTNVASFTSTTASSQTSTTQESISIQEKEEALDIISNLSDLTDEKANATVGRKVPPLRISLPRTPTEDGIVIASATDDLTLVATNAVRRNTRSAKSLTRRHQSPEPSTSSTYDESIQRVTRSKLRQSGKQLRDHPAVSYETSAKRKSNSWRRSSTTTVSPMLPSSAATSDEQTTSSNDAGDRADADESSHLEAAAQKDDENTLLALSLMKKNSYEGFRNFRSVIEERWAKDATEETVIPESPPNFSNYLIVQGNYTSANNPDSLPTQEKIDVLFMEKLTAKLRTLYTEQEERRRNMQIYHQVERERLRMQAESEVMRMLTRKANEHHESFSAMRVIRETNVFNTGFLEVKPKNLPVMETSDVKLKYEKLAETMRRRQQMEADALYAEQVFIWNAAVQRSEDATLSSLKNAVPLVSVSSLVLNL